MLSLYSAGIDVEEKYGRSRYLKWEDLLLEKKSGDVTEIDVRCTPELTGDRRKNQRRKMEKKE